ncbi:hypothetical protein FB565_004799 [Actinoplanes lutulentus]|uniref:Cold shock CspA family protein n=1 Tax=Actinoplanes lutulentus TaxID=1287878 RepID=A0A327Z7C2_9ACTN|nr:hypothetical protein [Actinoplanes lutulentus]MBB2945066.1 hypothetical protein [Actinoplanes lutulentus]RAK31862.1 hypothetical protein B0I29_114110 [Actinoplanes lutulentus]
MRANATLRIGIAMAAGTVVAGCATGSESPAAPSATSAVPSPSEAAPAPSEPVREPGDNPPVTGWVSGSVTRGGQGPCYGFTADDGTRYALYNADGKELTQGDRVKVQLETTLIRIYCGPGNLMAMTDAEPIK